MTSMRVNDQQQSFRPLAMALLISFGWSCPSNCSGLVSDGRCFSTSDDTPAAKEHPKLNNPQDSDQVS